MFGMPPAPETLWAGKEPLHVTVHVLQNVAAVLLNIVVRAFSKYLFQEDVWHLLQAR